jgi:hypothetical protein
MISEDFEFVVSQFADGTLAGAELESARVRIEGDADATALLAEYRRVDAMVSASSVMPAIDFDRLHAHLCSAIDADRPAVAGRIGFGSWRAWSAVAAGILVAVGVGSMVHRSGITPSGGVKTSPIAVVPQTQKPPGQNGPGESQPVGIQSGQMLVVGPTVESPAGPGSVEISIGPSPALAARDAGWQYADSDVISKPSSAIVIAARPSRRMGRIR